MQNYYSLFDSKAAAYLQPFLQKTDAMAVRAVRQALDDPQAPMAQFPEDFTLVRLGAFDENTGKLLPVDGPPETIVSVSALVNETPVERKIKEVKNDAA
jgi:transcription antitermination factor NusG